MVKDLLTQDVLDNFREGCGRVLAELLTAEGAPEGHKYACESGRLPHRYSFGTCSASRQMLHDPAWVAMIDLPATTPILKRLLGEDYGVSGAGGDLSLPGAIEYQHLCAPAACPSPFYAVTMIDCVTAWGCRHRDGPLPDIRRPPKAKLKRAEEDGLVPPGTADKDPADIDITTLRKVADLPHNGCGFNFIVQDLTWENGRECCCLG